MSELNKDNLKLEEQQKQRLNQSIKKKVVNGTDRGLKFSWKEYKEQANFYRKILYGSIFSNIVLALTIIVFQSSTVFFILDSEQKPIKLEQLAKLPLTEQRVISFADEAVTRIFTLDFRNIEAQIKLWQKYFNYAVYDKFLNEMKESNYISLVVKNKAIMSLVPTPTIYKIRVIGEDQIEVIRSYQRSDISKNVIETEETVYRIIVERVVPSDMNPWGFIVSEIKEQDIKNYLPKIN